jgi:hypothetical protein
VGNPVFPPKDHSMVSLKSKILRPATSSNYQCWFPPPTQVINWIRDKKAAGIDLVLDPSTFELISLNCTEASLPGSTFATTEINDDYTGVTERFAHRRQYDDRSEFTFIVDNSVNGKDDGTNYRVLLFFELWTQYVANEQYGDSGDRTAGLDDPNYFYRMNFPDDYRSPYIVVNKFEKDFKGNYLEYRFLNAYPLMVNSIPVSYESTQVLQCTVSFTYTRYVIRTRKHSNTLARPNTPIQPQVQPTFPEPPTGPVPIPVVPFTG